MLVDYEQLNETASVYIFPSSKSLKPFQAVIENTIFDFFKEWNSHGTPVNASFTIVDDHFLVVTVDEAKDSISGCSKDSLRHAIEQLGKSIDVDFFNNSHVYYLDQDEVKSMNFLEFKKMLKQQKFNAQTVVFDTLVDNKEKFNQEFKKELKDSAFAGWL